MSANLQPLYIVPYEQWIAYVRPDNLLFGNKGENPLNISKISAYESLLTEGLDVWMGATYTLQLFRMSVDFTHNQVIGKKSILDNILMWPNINLANILPQSTDFVFDTDREVHYEDAHW